MSWTYRPPTKFDARVSDMLEAVTNSETQQLNYYFPTKAAAMDRAENFRWFRWCVRQDGAQAGKWYKLEMENDYRTKVRYHPQSGWYLSVRCIPARLGYMHQLNPWLAELEQSAQ